MFEAIDAAHARIGGAHLELLRLVVEVDRSNAWKDQGARDVSHWLWMRYGISNWKAQRWVVAAHALECLPRLRAALAGGELGIDKVVELARFAVPETEAALIAWAKNVSCGAIRRRGDLVIRASREEVAEAEADRSVSWWYYDDGLRFGLEAMLPAAQGAIVARALERAAATIPVMPGEEDADFACARRADALVALCSGRPSEDAELDRATVVVHAQLSGLADATGGCEVEDGPVIQPEVARRLLCNARLQTVLEDEAGNVVGLGRTSREPSAWMVRQIRYRDRECRFPGCGARRFTEAHHIVWWRHGGRTDLDNLVLICSFHHRLVHESGWSIRRETDGEITWFHPDGVRYRAGPSRIAAVG
ncbi:MAG: HNH endonuclease [Actinobacteria bacterium]|nr:HNH endonuclease [Actinomycetota bacterium]